MARDARDLTTLWRDIEEVTDALEAAIAHLVRSPQPHEKLVEALIIDLQRLQNDCVAVRHLSAQQQKQYMAHHAVQQQRRVAQQLTQQQQQQQHQRQPQQHVHPGAPAQAGVQPAVPQGRLVVQQKQHTEAGARSVPPDSAQQLQRQCTSAHVQSQRPHLQQPGLAAQQQLTEQQHQQRQQPRPSA